MRWVSVDDELPPSDGRYLTFNPTSYWRVQVSVWLHEEDSWEHEWLKKKRSEIKPKTWITHWMHLPTEPEDV